MNETVKKEILIDTVVKVLNKTKAVLPTSPALNKLDELKKDIQSDFYTIVVVGEFKHGKTTFVNALLGDDILPVDVTPTTAAIHVLMWGEEKKLEIVKRNGEKEEKALNRQSLNDYVASQPFNPNEINHLKCIYPSELLKNRVVLVDTPGVNDLNEHRSEITHQFIPKADVVLFMLSMSAPVKKTEETFIRDHILKNDLDKIIYVANFVDRVDEEEIEDITDLIQRRIANITKDPHPNVMPISAIEALEARISNDEELYEMSGVQAVQEKIRNLIDSGSRSKEKLQRFEARLHIIFEDILTDVEFGKTVNTQTREELNNALVNLKIWMDESSKREQLLKTYIHDRESEIKYMIRKSLAYFSDKLKEDISDRIHHYNGSDIKGFVQSQLTYQIKTQVNRWLDEYGEYIHQLLFKLEQEISEGLTASFQKTITLKSYKPNRFHLQQMNQVDTPEAGNTAIKAGLWVGGASAFALALGGGLIIPIIGMAGMPFLQKKLADNQLQKVKPELLAQIDLYINDLTENMYTHIEQRVLSTVDQFVDKSLEAFNSEAYYVNERIKEHIKANQQNTNVINEQLQELSTLKEYIIRYSKEFGGNANE